MLFINFADSAHLKVDEMVPATASRRMSETRPDTESVSVPLVAADGLVPQVLKVQFVYFRGRLPWRPILFSALLLGLGNMTGPLVALLARRIGRTLQARVHFGRGGARGRESGVAASPETLPRSRPGEPTHADRVEIFLS